MKALAIVIIGILACMVAALAGENYRQREIIAEVQANYTAASMELTRARLQVEGLRDTVHQLRTGRID